MLTTDTPLLALTVRISPALYTACNLIMGERIKAKAMPRSIVLGGIFAASAVGFLCYLILALRQADGVIILLSLLLLLLGVYNLLYYPLLFQRLLKKQAAAIYKKSTYLGKAIRLLFYEDYIEEQVSGNGGNGRVSWSSIVSVDRYRDFTLLRLGPNNGIIIPTEGLDEDQKITLELLLERKMTGKDKRAQG